MKREREEGYALRYLGLAAASGALLISGALFIAWFLAFAVMGLIGHSLLVGMNYLVWPIIFPIMAFPVFFLLLLPLVPLFKRPYRDLLAMPRFHFAGLLPIFLLALAIMLASCPLDIGGTLLTRGLGAFG